MTVMAETLSRSDVAGNVHENGRSPNTVLIVDDYPVDRRIAGAIVEKHTGLSPTYAGDGREALESIERELPAVVLTDLQMPGMDGLALVQGIREKYPRLPVILMTAHGSEDVAMLALRAGATNYVPKKTLSRELAETLRHVLDLSAIDRDRRRILGALERRESSFKVENDPNLITPLIQLLQEDLGGMGLCDATARMRVGVALQEALSNALYHGNLEVSSDLRQEDEREFYGLAALRRAEEPYRDRRIRVHARLDREVVTYAIEDEGPGFDTSSLDRPIDPEDLMRVGGRGLLLIRTFMDEVVFNEQGNRITLIKRSPSKA
jgi:CheY-like chemotaxis protein